MLARGAGLLALGSSGSSRSSWRNKLFAACSGTCSVPPRLTAPRPARPSTRQLSVAGSLQLEDPGPGPDGQGSAASWVNMENILTDPNTQTPFKNQNNCSVPVTW